jgi:hypothetical protein
MRATARKRWCAAPNCFHVLVHTPADPTRTPELNGHPRGGDSGAWVLDTLRRHFTVHGGPRER